MLAVAVLAAVVLKAKLPPRSKCAVHRLAASSYGACDVLGNSPDICRSLCGMLEAGAPISPPTSVPASPVFEWSKIGTDWEADGSTLIASGMLAEERYAVGSKIVRSGKTTFTYTINKVFYPDAHLFVGVSEVTDDPENAKTWAFNGPTGNLWALLLSLAASCKASSASDVRKPERHLQVYWLQAQRTRTGAAQGAPTRRAGRCDRR